MNLPDNPPAWLPVLLQFISSMAIASGLIFTGLQFRHWRRVAHVANFTKLVELQMHLREMRVSDPRLAHVYKHDVETGATDEDIRFYFFNLMQLSIFEIVWFSYKQEQIPEEYFLSWERRMKQVAEEETFHKMFDSPRMKFLHDDFQAYMKGLVSVCRVGAAGKGVQAGVGAGQTGGSGGGR
jgi:hypothetical protein